jgi:hypothetical protein
VIPNCVTGFVVCVLKTSASAVIVSSRKTGAVNFYSWFMKTVPGPGRSMATSACRRPVVSPPWTTEPAKWCGGRKVLAKMKRIAIAAELCELLDVFGSERQATGCSVSNADVHIGTSVQRVP